MTQVRKFPRVTAPRQNHLGGGRAEEAAVSQCSGSREHKHMPQAFLLCPLSPHLGLSLLDVPISQESLSHPFAAPPAHGLWKHPPRQSQKCLLLISQAFSRPGKRVNCHIIPSKGSHHQKKYFQFRYLCIRNSSF